VSKQPTFGFFRVSVGKTSNINPGNLFSILARVLEQASGSPDSFPLDEDRTKKHSGDDESPRPISRIRRSNPTKPIHSSSKNDDEPE
jgi:hypothetical protein